jgi:hypothetical protein
LNFGPYNRVQRPPLRAALFYYLTSVTLFVGWKLSYEIQILFIQYSLLFLTLFPSAFFSFVASSGALFVVFLIFDDKAFSHLSPT